MKNQKLSIHDIKSKSIIKGNNQLLAIKGGVKIVGGIGFDISLLNYEDGTE